MRPPLQLGVRHLARVGCVLLLAGCSVQMFLRVDRLRIDEQVLYFLGGGGNSLVLTHGANKAFVSDVKFGGMARELRHELHSGLAREVQRLLLTHSHLDHTGGLALYPEVGAVVVHPNTRRRLEQEGARGPFVEVETQIELRLGAETVRISYQGVGHTDGDLVALLVSRKLLVSGDLLVNGFEPSIDETAGGNALAFRATLDRLLQLDFEKALPGHGEVMTRAEVEHLRDYLLAIETAAREARRTGKTIEEVVRDTQFPGFDDLKPVPFGANRQKTIRQMYEALENA